MKEPSIAGIRFYVLNKKYSSSSEGGFSGTVELMCSFRREDLWEAITNRLNGLELHKGGDIQSALIDILEGRVDILERELVAKGTEDLQRAQRAEQTASLAEADKVRAVQQAQLLQHQLDLLKVELTTAQELLQRWNTWYAAHKPRCTLPEG